MRVLAQVRDALRGIPALDASYRRAAERFGAGTVSAGRRAQQLRDATANTAASWPGWLS
ncbi:MAG TPA: hypothetical protein VEJ84_06495 [Acidimicrobiales bacterium]|nr:hypothetical protein [Acidimicrobiales bacterium]